MLRLFSGLRLASLEQAQGTITGRWCRDLANESAASPDGLPNRCASAGTRAALPTASERVYALAAADAKDGLAKFATFRACCLLRAGLVRRWFGRPTVRSCLDAGCHLTPAESCATLRFANTPMP